MHNNFQFVAILFYYIPFYSNNMYYIALSITFPGHDCVSMAILYYVTVLIIIGYV